jgi:hypothetical protein
MLAVEPAEGANRYHKSRRPRPAPTRAKMPAVEPAEGVRRYYTSRPPRPAPTRAKMPAVEPAEGANRYHKSPREGSIGFDILLRPLEGVFPHSIEECDHVVVVNPCLEHPLR